MADVLLLTPEEAAKRLSIGRSAVFDLLRRGELESLTIGRSRRIPRDALLKFIEAQRQAQLGLA